METTLHGYSKDVDLQPPTCLLTNGSDDEPVDTHTTGMTRHQSKGSQAKMMFLSFTKSVNSSTVPGQQPKDTIQNTSLLLLNNSTGARNTYMSSEKTVSSVSCTFSNTSLRQQINPLLNCRYVMQPNTGSSVIQLGWRSGLREKGGERGWMVGVCGVFGYLYSLAKYQCEQTRTTIDRVLIMRASSFRDTDNKTTPNMNLLYALTLLKRFCCVN